MTLELAIEKLEEDNAIEELPEDYHEAFEKVLEAAKLLFELKTI